MKNILFCTGGERGRWILRTAWALWAGNHESFIPFEIRVLTTRPMAIQIKENLLHPEQGWFNSFVREYKAHDQVHFSEDSIKVLSRGSTPLDSIQSQEDSLAAAQCVFEEIRNLCADKDTRLHVSLNGAQGLLGVYLAAAISVHGRQLDRLTQTMVLNDLADHPDFYYPSSIPRQYYVPGHIAIEPKILSCADSEIRIVDVPMRFLTEILTPDETQLVQDSLMPAHDFNQISPTVSGISQHYIERPVASLNMDRNSLTWKKSHSIQLTALESLLYSYFILQKSECYMFGPCKTCSSLCFVLPVDMEKNFFIDRLKKVWGPKSSKLSKIEAKFENNFDLNSWLLQHRSRINKKIRKVGFPASLKIASAGVYGMTTYGIPHEKVLLKINGE